MDTRSVGAYEAKTHLPRLLDEVARGRTIIITKHGVPVARLVPANNEARGGTDEIIEELRRFRKDNRLGGLSLREMIEAGRP